MGGRRPSPALLHAINGNKSHLTHAEMIERANSQISMGDHTFKCPENVFADKVARKKWDEVTRIYIDNKATFASTTDSGLIERYCLAYSQYDRLKKTEKSIIDMHQGDCMAAHMACEKIKLLQRINEVQAQLLRMEDFLILTPLSKIKSVPKKQSKQSEDTSKEMFGD